jgi:anti-sigma B factor antagonist
MIPMYVADHPPAPPARAETARVTASRRRADAIPGRASFPALGLTVVSERRGTTHRIAPSGELDLATSPELERELLRAEQTDAEEIELDLAGLTFIDSAGIRVLISAEARSDADGSRLRIKAVTPVARRILALVDADRAD